MGQQMNVEHFRHLGPWIQPLKLGIARYVACYCVTRDESRDFTNNGQLIQKTRKARVQDMHWHANLSAAFNGTMREPGSIYYFCICVMKTDGRCRNFAPPYCFRKKMSLLEGLLCGVSRIRQLPTWLKDFHFKLRVLVRWHFCSLFLDDSCRSFTDLKQLRYEYYWTHDDYEF